MLLVLKRKRKPNVHLGNALHKMEDFRFMYRNNFSNNNYMNDSILGQLQKFFS